MASINLGKVVPERGVDYWTSEDKEEIVAEVVEEVDDEIEQVKQEITDAEQSTVKSKTFDSLDARLEEIESDANTLNEDKVDKVSGKQLSTEDYTTAEKTKLDGIASGAQVNVLEGLTLGGTDLVVSGKKTEIKDPEVTNARQSTTKSKTFESVDARFEELEDDVNSIKMEVGHIYGIKRKISNNTSPAWERIFDSVGKTANATHDGNSVQNDFDDLDPWADIKSCNYDLTTNKIKAWFGDANFKFDGTNGDVYTYIPKTYWRIYQKDDYDYILLADSPRTGFIEVDGFFVARYCGAIVSDVLHSYNGLVPTTSKTRAQFRTLANALGSNFSQLDWRYFIIQLLYLVEYASYNSQTKLGVGIDNRKHMKALVAENDTNRVIISSSAGYYVGQTVRIGTVDGGSQVADARTITSIDSYSEGGVTGYALTFDGTAVNIAIDNQICTMAQAAGQCDSLGMKSGTLNNDGYHSMIYRGIENVFGNIYQWLDGINISDYVVYICKNPAQYADDTFVSPYKALGYNPTTSSDGFIKNLGLDLSELFFRFPIELGADSATNVTDKYYVNSGNRCARIGGGLGAVLDVGFWLYNFASDSSYNDWKVGGRVFISE